MADDAGTAQLCWTIKCPAEHETEGDRLFACHAAWMAETHPREGEQALLRYIVSKSHDEDGTAYFRLTEIYRSQAGIDHHRDLGRHREQGWADDFEAWVGQCETTDWTDDAVVMHTL